jgi:hypothetical protein
LWVLDAQQGLFKLTMKSNATQAMVEVVALAFNKVNVTIINRLTCMWGVMHASQLLCNVFPKYLKVVEIAMIHVLGFVEDEQCFNSVAFMKNKMCNKLDNHFQLGFFVYAQIFFTLHNFPYEDSYEMWSIVQLANGRGRYA